MDIYIYMNIVLIISSSYLDMPSKILEFIHMIFTCSLVKAYHLFDDLKRSHFCSSWRAVAYGALGDPGSGGGVGAVMNDDFSRCFSDVLIPSGNLT